MSDDTVQVPRWLADELVQGQVVQPEELIGYEPDEPDDEGTSTMTATQPTHSPPATPQSLTEVEQRAAELQKEGKWAEAMSVRNAWSWNNRNAYVGAPETPPAPTPAPAPEPMTVDQLHTQIRDAEAAGTAGVMRAIAFKTQLLNMRGNQ